MQSVKHWLQRGLPLWLFGRDLVRQFNRKGCRQQAAALTYMTLFAMVPTLTVVFSVFSLFPAFDGLEVQLKEMLFKHLLPASGLNVETYLNDFLDQARSLTVAGLLLLVVTSYFMLKNIEKTFNGIWGVSEARKGVSNFLLYWAVLSLGPLLLGAGLAMSTYLLSLRILVDEFDALGVIPLVLTYFPWLLTALAFTLLFAAVPNCRVPMRQAMVGGALTALCFELCKNLFGWIVANSSYTAVYGAFAMVPLFLLWIYILWTILLAGAVLVRCLSSFRGVVSGEERSDLLAALQVLSRLQIMHRSGLNVSEGALLLLGLPPEQWQRLRRLFLRHRLIAITAQGHYVLSHSLATVTLAEFLGMIGVKPLMNGMGGVAQESESWLPAVCERLKGVDDFVVEHLNTDLQTLLDAGSMSPARGE